MAFTDWNLFTRVTENSLPSDIRFVSETGTPVGGFESLNIVDFGTPEISTVAFRLNQIDFLGNLDAGRIQTVFRKKTGLGFRDSGIFFLSQGENPLLNNVKVYGVHFTDNGTTVRVRKYLNGLHDLSSTISLKNYIVPFSGSDEFVVMEVEWFGGLIGNSLGGVQIDVRFGSNTTNFNNLVPLTPVVLDTSNPLLFSGGEGFFVRSRSGLEPLDALVDNTSVFFRNFV
jgi:hypothetical protein